MIRFLPILFVFLIAGCQPRLARHLARGKAYTLEVRTTGCYGTCPVYHLRVASDGSAHYRGLHHVTHRDTLNVQLPDSAVVRLRQALIASRFSTLDSVYDDPYVTDLPSTRMVLTLPANGYQKAVTSRVGAPPRLDTLQQHLRRLHNTYFQ